MKLCTPFMEIKVQYLVTAITFLISPKQDCYEVAHF